MSFLFDHALYTCPIMRNNLKGGIIMIILVSIILFTVGIILGILLGVMFMYKTLIEESRKKNSEHVDRIRTDYSDHCRKFNEGLEEEE